MTRIAAGLIVATLIVGGGMRANAQTCRQNAQADFKACKQECLNDFTAERAACLNITPGCFAACLDGRTECITTAKEPLTGCLALCKPPLDAAKAQCRTQCLCGQPNNPCGFNPCFLGCITPAEDVAFECRNACQDAFRLNTAAQAALAQCKTDFHTCIQNCPPATATTTTTVP